MGKTKTVFVGAEPGEEKSGKVAYEEKRRKKDQEKRKQETKDKKQVTKVGLKGGERIKIVGADAPIDEKTATEGTDKTSEDADKKHKPKVRSKKYKSALSKVDKSKLYSVKDAVKLVKKSSYSSFNGTVELHLVTLKSNVLLNINLPHSTGKTKKVEIADEKTIAKLKKGKVDFDLLLATTDMMPLLVPFAKTLGPKGLMPNPKNGTLIKTKADAKKFSADSISIKTEKKVPLIHTVVGKVDQKEAELVKNIEKIIDAVGKKQISKAYITSTMGPSIKLVI